MSLEMAAVAATNQRSSLRPLAVGALLLMATALCFDVHLWLTFAATAIRFPFELDYGEGIVLQQMLHILDGEGYGPIDRFPAIVFHYPPLYHLASAAVAMLWGIDPLAAGRLVSVSATLLVGLLAGLIVFHAVRDDTPRPAAAICAIAGALVTLSFWPIVAWSPLMRVDMAAQAFALAGVWLGLLALKRPKLIHLAALCFVAAVYSKQTAIVAPAATLLTLFAVKPRAAWTLLASCLALGLVALGALEWLSGGGFLRHVLLYNINRFEASRLLWIASALGAHALYFGLILISLRYRLKERLPAYRGVGLRELRERLLRSQSDASLLLLLVYFGLATLMLVTVAKSGSNLNYFIDWMCVAGILVGIACRTAAVTAVAPRAAPQGSLLLAVAVPAAIGIQAIMLEPPPDYRVQLDPKRQREMHELVSIVREADRPVISDDMVLLLRAGQPVLWEPAIFAELASKGIWDERPFTARIRCGDFAFFATAGERGETLFDSRYNPAVSDAIDAAYPTKTVFAGLTLHLPRGAPTRAPGCPPPAPKPTLSPAFSAPAAAAAVH